jgi:TIR domain-containing protein
MTPTSSKTKANFLRLVDTQSPATPISKETFARPAWQSTLFANENPSLLLFINFERVAESDFVNILTGAHPKILFDLRRVPRFDSGSLNRRRAFAIFSDAGIRYIDLSGQLRTGEGSASNLAAPHVARLITESWGQNSIHGPVGFIVDAQQFEESYITQLIEALPSIFDHPWDVLRLPISDGSNRAKEAQRDLVFISHANPEDNAFATWLAGQLTIAGYSVWSDATKLVAGDIFWDDIEEAIRHRSAKVVAVLSKDSQGKQGVLDELDLAVRVERSMGLTRFVLPVRVDHVPHNLIRANIARKMVIDFNENWASGLYALLSVLERDRVPRIDAGNAQGLSGWVRERFAQLNRIVPEPEILISNWLPISKFPDQIVLYNVSAPIDKIDSVLHSIALPCFRYLRLIGSFSSIPDLQQDLPPDVKLTETYRIDTRDFLVGKPHDLPGLAKREAHNFMISLLRQAWDLKMKRRGLKPFETASGHIAWYMPKDYLETNRVEFLDDAGKKRRKSLVGWSERRKVFWHFAVEARPVLGVSPHLLLKLHVIFTPDGISPVDSKERMHLLRRRFCKNWWNDRWRDLLIAFVHWLASGEDCVLELGMSANIRLSRKLMTIASPVSVAADPSLFAVSYEDEDELNSGDAGDLIEEMSEDFPEDQSEIART